MFRNNLELIIGPMFSGKSAELIRRIDRYNIAGYRVLLVKPRIDTRSEHVKSRNGIKLECISLEDISKVYDVNISLSIKENKKIDIVAFDEAQFFKDSYIVVKDLLQKGFKVIVSALDTDFNGNPFGDITKLVTLSDSITKLTAICMKCRNDFAIFSQKLKKGGNQIEVGDIQLYEPRCLNCFVPGGIEK